jgi:hypothetical protein
MTISCLRRGGEEVRGEENEGEGRTGHLVFEVLGGDERVEPVRVPDHSDYQLELRESEKERKIEESENAQVRKVLPLQRHDLSTRSSDVRVELHIGSYDISFILSQHPQPPKSSTRKRGGRRRGDRE